MALTRRAVMHVQCYLNITGGVCPIVDCSKSLVNGQCGGAKNGKCEVDPNKDCAAGVNFAETMNRDVWKNSLILAYRFVISPRLISR